MAGYLLGIDNGGTATKAGLFDLGGRELAVAGRKADTAQPAPGWHERDMESMWRATVGAIREVLQKSAIDPAQIAAVAVTGYGNGLYLVDKAGRPVRPAIDSSDSRARAVVDRWLAEGVWERVLPRTAQSLWPAQPNALLAWLREHEPDSLRRAGWVLCAKDYTRFRLTGRIAMELTDMSATSLMSVTEARYDDSILEAFGLGELAGLLPPLVRPDEIVGEVTAAAAAETGLRAGTPVAGGMFDIDACGLAAGMVEESQLVLVSGTWGNNQYISRTPVVSKKMFMTSCYAIPGHYLMLEGSPTSAGNLEWILGELLGGALDYERLGAEVAATAPADARIVFLPFLYGSNMHPGARSCFLGLRSGHTRGHLLRAALEGTVFSHFTHLRRLLEFRALPREILFTGGGSRSEVWTQIFADCFQIPFVIPAGTELGALGAAIGAAVAAGIYENYQAAVKAMTRPGRVQQPDARMKGLYEEKYETYLKVQEALEPVWERLE